MLILVSCELDTNKYIILLVEVQSLASGVTVLEVLVDTGATRNFVTEFCAKKYSMLLVKSTTALTVCTINRNDLQTSHIFKPLLKVTDTQETVKKSAEKLVVADIAGYNIVLSMLWLKKYNLDIY